MDDSGDIRDDAEAEQELLSNVQGTSRRVRPEFVNYAKRAKRVDVRKLKDNIWKNLDIIVPETKEDDEDAMVCYLFSRTCSQVDSWRRTWMTSRRLIHQSREYLTTSSAV